MSAVDVAPGTAGAGATAGSAGRPRVGIIGCGDVAHRHYLPALAGLTDLVELLGCSDPRPDAAEQAAVAARGWSPEVRAFGDPAAMIRDAALDAVFNLSPAPLHAAVSTAALEAGAHVYSEKPVAGTLADADRLIALAADRGLLLLCAPGEAVSSRIRWLGQIIASERLGRLTLAVTHHADTGPANWREYTGDPTVFYAEGVGPVFDHGVYRLHVLTTLLGPVRRVQAMGTISAPERYVRAGRLAGRTIPVTTADHVMMNMEFANGALGQLLTSFAAPGTQTPWLELHFSRGTISFPGPSWDREGTASIFFDDDSQLGLEGWIHGLRPPPPADGRMVIDAGVAHFAACLRGEETPVLTAEHARHVLDIILKAYESVADGLSHETETTF
jgi:predicted dehydrogenase